MEAPLATPLQQHATCLNHPQVETREACEDCERPFCGDCLVRLQNRQRCADCKARMLRGLQRRGGGPSRLAQDAFMSALLGLVICGPVLQPMALLKGTRALRQYQQDPSQPDRWKATAAVVISAVMIVFYVLYFGFLIFSVVGR